jgi:hypothetical protein
VVFDSKSGKGFRRFESLRSLGICTLGLYRSVVVEGGGVDSESGEYMLVLLVEGGNAICRRLGGFFGGGSPC